MKYSLDSLRSGVVDGAPTRLTKHKNIECSNIEAYYY